MSLKDTIASLSYHAPKGKVDLPYFYVYDASALTDGSSYQNLTVLTTNDDFYLRRIAGMNLCLNPNATGSFLMFDRGRRQMYQSAIRPGLLLDGATPSGSWPVLPESLYTPASTISFNLNGVLRSFTADTPNIYNSQIAFQGVRRFDSSQLRLYRTPYKYRELPYSYTYALNLNWSHWTNASGSAIRNNPRTFYVPILEVDFELCQILVTYANGNKVTTNDFQMSLYDVSGTQQFMSAPVNVLALNGSSPTQYGSPVFPIPSLAWPMKGLIRFDIISMLPVGTTQSYVIEFRGIWRVPA